MDECKALRQNLESGLTFCLVLGLRPEPGTHKVRASQVVVVLQLCIHPIADELSVCPCVKTISVHLLIQDAVITLHGGVSCAFRKGFFQANLGSRRGQSIAC